MPFANVRETYSPAAIRKAAGYFRKIVLWGLNHGINGTHTHRHIFRAYYEAARKLGLPIVWLSDKCPTDEITADDLVFIHGVNHHLNCVLDKNPVIVDFHVDKCETLLGPNYARIRNYERRITELERDMPSAGTTFEWDNYTFYNRDLRVLMQPWGSDLLENEFFPAVDNQFSNKIYWIGSWWHSPVEHWGNYNELHVTKRWMDQRGMQMVPFIDCDSLRNRIFVRASRIAPAISGEGQVETNYLACRIFKNISYGQFAISNVAKSQELLDGTAIYDADIPAMLDKAMGVPFEKAKELVRFQQQKIRNFNVAAHLYIILMTAIEYCPKVKS